LLQATHAWLKPYDPPESISNIVPYWSVIVLLASIVAFGFAVGSSILVRVAAVALAIGVLRSPTTRFFIDSFQPNYLSIASIIAGVSTAVLLGWRVAGMLIAGIGVSVMPQSLITAAAAVPWVAWTSLEASPTWALWLRRSLGFGLVLCAPLAVYLVTSYLFVLQGYSEIFLHTQLLPLMFVSDPAAGRFFVDQIGYAGVGLVTLTLFLTGAALLVAFRRQLFVDGVLALFPWLGFVITFVIAYPLFKANTYYAYNLVLAAVLGAIVAIHILGRASEGTSMPVRTSGFRQWAVPGLALFLVAATPMAVIKPSGHHWSSEYIYLQLAAKRSQPEVCQPEPLRNFLRGVSYDVPILLDCQTLDPTCRTATGYRGRNSPSEVFDRPDSRALIHDAATRSGLFVACETYRRRDPASFAAQLLKERSDVVLEQGGWVIYRFRSIH
jgi:hypothetical protein